MPRFHPRRRAGFTLIELIVVVVLILFLAGMAARFLPTAASQAREANTAVLVQGWLNLAKQRALRDQAPRGIRLWNKNGDLRVIECEFVEVPDPYASDPLWTDPNDPTISSIIFSAPTPPAALTNGYPGSPELWLVQPGDYLSVNGGQMHQITSLTVGPLPNQVRATLNSPFPTPVYTVNGAGTPVGTPNYFIQRAPRPLGEDPLQMPVDDPTPATLRAVVIDLNTNIAPAFKNAATGAPWNYVPVTASTPYLDILFNPSGSALVFVATLNANKTVTSSPIAVPGGILNLWVRTVDPASNPTNNFFAGDPTLVSIHLASGFVGAYSPDVQMPGNNPYTMVK